MIQGAKRNKSVAAKKTAILKMLEAKIAEHQKYICEHGDDPEDVKNLKW